MTNDRITIEDQQRVANFAGRNAQRRIDRSTTSIIECSRTGPIHCRRLDIHRHPLLDRPRV